MSPDFQANQAPPTVSGDWRRPLPEDRQRLFDHQTTEWERSYTMFSLTLNSALEARSQGELVRARQEVACASDLVRRLSGSLVPTLAVLARNRQWRRNPAVEPLQPDDSQLESAQEAATWNRILHWPLVFRRWQFALKLRSLTQTIQVVTHEFCDLADDISQGICVDPGKAWRALEGLHDDLNTVLREVFVVLKSFLCAVSLEGYRLFLAALGEGKVNRFQPEGGISPASP